MEGVRRKKRCQIDCQQHMLSLLCYQNISKYDISMMFCPKYQRQPLLPQQTYPQYNNDGKYFTPAFVLGVDTKQLHKNLEQQRMIHNKLVKQSLQKNNQACFPRPNAKHTLCSVCKENYRNYYEHILADTHSQKINSNVYNSHIMELCDLFKEQWQGAQERADEQAQRQYQQKLQATNKQTNSIDENEQILQEEGMKQKSTQNYKQRNSQGKKEGDEKKNYTDIARVDSEKIARRGYEEETKKKIINNNREPVKCTQENKEELPLNHQKTKANNQYGEFVWGRRENSKPNPSLKEDYKQKFKQYERQPVKNANYTTEVKGPMYVYPTSTFKRPEGSQVNPRSYVSNYYYNNGYHDIKSNGRNEYINPDKCMYSMIYQHPPPPQPQWQQYCMPLVQTNNKQSSEKTTHVPLITPNNNTNININFPMYFPYQQHPYNTHPYNIHPNLPPPPPHIQQHPHHSNNRYGNFMYPYESSNHPHKKTDYSSK